MQLCTDNNVGLSFLTPYGKFMGRVNGRVRGNVLPQAYPVPYC